MERAPVGLKAGDGGVTPVGIGGQTRQDRPIGWIAAAVAVAIWAGWLVGARFSVDPAVAAGLTPLDVAFCRYVAPALLFAPVWLRAGLRPRREGTPVSWMVLAGMFGWGAPFALAASQGMTLSGVASAAALIPGTMPLWAAALGAVLLSSRRTGPASNLHGWRLLGLGLIALAAAMLMGPALIGSMLIGAPSAGGAALAGMPWLLLAAIFWAGFSVAFSMSGLGPVHAAGLVSAYSTLLLGPAMLASAIGWAPVSWSGAGAWTVEVWVWSLLGHGVLAGAVSIAAFALAVTKLGAGRATACAALVPGLAAVMGWAWLGEAVSLAQCAALVLATIGVVLVNAVPAQRAEIAKAT